MRLELTLRDGKGRIDCVVDLDNVINFFINDNGDYFASYYNIAGNRVEVEYRKETIYKFFIY